MGGLEEADVTTYCFGDCRFIPARQLLLHRELPIRVGARAIDLLHALVRRPGVVVSKNELFRAAWPNVFVDEANLKVNIAALRRALAQVEPEFTCIATVPGRGYRFVAPLRVLGGADEVALSEAVRGITGELPGITALIGRDEAVAQIVGALAETRLLTIVGPPGVGKTSVGIAAAGQMGERLKDGVSFVDLAAIDSPQLVEPAIAVACGLDSNLVNVLAGLVERLRDRELLLVLDNCDHVLSAAATVADHLNYALPKLLVVTTSREPLRCRWESVYRLAPLRSPPAGSEMDAATAITFSAVELLVRRAATHGYQLDDADVPCLAAIGRRLDGIALALELAAPRLATDGPAKLADQLENAFDGFVLQGNAGTPRHMTLMAMLDWSYRLLPAREASLLRHLSVYSGTFALNDVVGVCGYLGSIEDVGAWLESLAARSLLSVSYHTGRRYYRLLDSTRSFGSEHLRTEGEQQAAMASYAGYLLALFEQAEDEWKRLTRKDWIARYGNWGNDLRRAIDWSFGSGENVELGVRLTVAGTILWQELSSFVEHQSRITTALDGTERLPTCDRTLKLKLLAAQAVNLCQTGNLVRVVGILQDGIGLAEELGDVEYRVRMLALLGGVHFFSGRYSEALSTLSESRTILEMAGESSAIPDIQWHELMNRFCLGEIRYAYQGLAESAREHATIAHRSQASRFVIDRFVAIRTFLSLAAWTIGEPRRGLDAAQEAVDAAETLNHAVSHAFVLGLAAIPVSLLCGFLDVAQKHVTALFDYLTLHQDDIWPPFARFYQAIIDARQGDSDGLGRMRGAIDELVTSNYLIHLPLRLAMLADVALSYDRLDIARASIVEALEHLERNGERWCRAELLRLQGMVRWREGDVQEAERLLQEAVQNSRQSGALSFELRAATSLAELELQTGRDDGLAQLGVIFRQFDDSFHSADIVAARTLLGMHHIVVHRPHN